MAERKSIPPRLTDGRKGYTADRKGNIYDPSGRRLTPTPVKGGTSRAGDATVGHLKVHIGDKWPYVHRLVAAAFGMDIRGAEVRHKDSNPKNNAAKNLRTGSRDDNAQDRRALRERMADKMTEK